MARQGHRHAVAAGELKMVGAITEQPTLIVNNQMMEVPPSLTNC
jgi:hypothetical protein